MYLVWDTIGDGGERILGDRTALAGIYEVSARTVQRHCTPVKYLPSAGQPRGLSGAALYDVLAAAVVLEDIQPRARSLAHHVRARMERRYLT